VYDSYDELVEVLDVDNFIKYILVNSFANTKDWPDNNFFYARSENEPFRFYFWDAEFSFSGVDQSTFDRLIVTNPNSQSKNLIIQILFTKLYTVPQFRAKVGDLWEKLFSDKGPLSRDRITQLYQETNAEAEPSINHIFKTSGEFVQFQQWFEERQDYMFSDFYEKKLVSGIEPPVPTVFEGGVAEGRGLMFVHDDESVQIFYTLDGSDPAGRHGVPLTSPIWATKGVNRVTYRAMKDGRWSPLRKISYIAESSEISRVVGFSDDWRYHSEGMNLGDSWRDALYDDSSWSIGSGILGGGEASPGQLGTRIDLHGGPTYYFRNTFSFDGSLTASGIVLTQYVNGGVIFYINGEEVYRRNMRSSDVDFSTWSVGADQEVITDYVPIPAELLMSGENILCRGSPADR